MVKVFFSDFWKEFDYKCNFIINHLKNLGIEVKLDPNPDFLFFSSQGREHLKYLNCVKIYFTGENDVPDFNYCDYAISFHHLNFNDRHLRYPLYLLYDDCFTQIKSNKYILPELANRKFCNFVYSNSKLADPFREYFFHELSKYKKIDSGGRYLNNIGGPVANKLDFIQEYKFTIAFENSSMNGYTTEKIIEPMKVNSMPIYWGNPTVDTDFNTDSFIWIKDKSKVKEAIDYIVSLDENEESYLNKLASPWLSEEQSRKNWGADFAHFIQKIVTQTPLQAKRVTDYGYVRLNKKRESSTIKRLFSFFLNK